MVAVPALVLHNGGRRARTVRVEGALAAVVVVATAAAAAVPLTEVSIAPQVARRVVRFDRPGGFDCPLGGQCQRGSVCATFGRPLLGRAAARS